MFFFFFSSRRRHTRFSRDWSSDVCSSDLDDLEVRGEAENSGGALNAIRRQRFDLAIVDIGLRGSANGIELMKSIKAERPDLPVLMVSMYDEMLYAERAL